MDTSSQSGGEFEQHRDRSRRSERGTRFSDADGGDANQPRDRSSNRVTKRVYVSNIPYEYRWQDLKDLFRRIVGTVDFVELFVDEKNKPRGCGIVEFSDPEHVQKAMEKMNRYDLNGREIVVKADHGEERDKHGRIGREREAANSNRAANSQRGGGGGNGGSGGGRRDRGENDRSFMMNRNDLFGLIAGGGSGLNNNNGNNGGGNFNNQFDYDSSSVNSSFNTYGLSASFLNSLGIQGPLHTKVFIANLDYKVDAKKLKEVFKLAGRIASIDLATEKTGASRGFAIVEYEHPVEAVQAISMLDRQMLFERRMTVRLDRVPDKNEQVKLPEGLGGLGIGLGQNGEPLRNVAANLPNMQQQNQNNQQNNMGNSNINPAPVPVAAPNNSNLIGSVPNSSNSLGNNLAALNSVVGSLGNLGALSNPLLSSAAASLNSLGLNLGGASGNNSDHGNNSSSQNYNQQPTNFNSSYGHFGGSNSRGGGSDFDLGPSNSVRNYSTQPQDDFSHGSGVSSYNSNISQQGLNALSNQQQQQQMGGNGGSSGGGNLNNARGSDTILIRNLPQGCTWQTLRDKFRDIGEVKFAEIKGQDCGVVRFSKERDAELAIKLMDGARFEGRTVDVRFF